MENQFLQEAKALAPYMEEVFYHLHRHPELSGKEFETQKCILNELEAMGIEVVALPGSAIGRGDLADAQALFVRTRTRCDGA